MAKRRVAQLEAENARLRDFIPQQALQGQTMRSPFVEPEKSSRSLLPWRRASIDEVESRIERKEHALGMDLIAAQPLMESAGSGPAKAAPRAGFLADVPVGGSTEWNQGYTQIGGVADRRTFMEQLQQLYVACQPAASAVDAIARFCSAGDMDIVPDDESKQKLEDVVLSGPAARCKGLFDYVNPAQNFRQLMRGIFTDLLIYGDAFVEVVWGPFNEPIGLYSLPCPTMLIIADDHGNVTQYVQKTPQNQRASFAPREVLHFKFDSPRGGLYGLGPTEKTVHPIVTWVSTEGLLKKTIQKGNPPNLAIAWDPNVPLNTRKRLNQQYMSKNLGPENVGYPIEVEGGTELHEFAQNKLAEYGATKKDSRDEIVSGYGMQPAVAGIIESGNLGSGTGTSQFKNFKVITCKPIEEIVLEVFTYSVLEQGFGVQGYRCKFGEVDWRDDEVIEKIMLTRVDRGIWTIDRARDSVGEPPVTGGDKAVIILARDVIQVEDIAAKSTQGLGPTGPGTGLQGGGGQQTAPVGDPIPNEPAGADDRSAPPKATKRPPAMESFDEDELIETWRADVAARRMPIAVRRARAMQELS